MEKREMRKVYEDKGLNALYAYLDKNGIKYRIKTVEFGTAGSKKAVADRQAWRDGEQESELRLYYCNRLVKARKNGYCYNIARGRLIVLQ